MTYRKGLQEERVCAMLFFRSSIQQTTPEGMRPAHLPQINGQLRLPTR